MLKYEEKHNIHVSSFHILFLQVLGLILVYPWFKFGFMCGFDIFVLLLAIPPKSLFLGLKDSHRNRKGKEKKKR